MGNGPSLRRRAGAANRSRFSSGGGQLEAGGSESTLRQRAIELCMKNGPGLCKPGALSFEPAADADAHQNAHSFLRFRPPDIRRPRPAGSFSNQVSAASALAKTLMCSGSPTGLLLLTCDRHCVSLSDNFGLSSKGSSLLSTSLRLNNASPISPRINRTVPVTISQCGYARNKYKAFVIFASFRCKSTSGGRRGAHYRRGTTTSLTSSRSSVSGP
jgi:hypothetical protein